MNNHDMSRAAALELVDCAGAVLAVLGVAVSPHQVEEARRRTLNQGRAVRDGDIVAFRLLDEAGATLAAGQMEPMHVAEGQAL